MGKIHFGVINFRKYLSNITIFAMILIVGVVAFLGGRAVDVSNAVSGVYYNGDRSSKNISLMINVYWGTEYLDSMLKTLQEKGVKTTFFVGGTWAVLNEEMLNKIYEQGHEIGNHGYHHKDHDKISEQENYNEIANTHNIIKQLLGVEMTLFAPPSGAYNKVTVQSANSLGYKTIMWTRDTIDWRDKDTNLIYNRAIKNASGGDLVLMHPTQNTMEALPMIIDTLLQRGFSIVPVSVNIGQLGD